MAAKRRKRAKAVCYGADPAHAVHVKGCRPGRPLCRYRRLERPNRAPCHCGAYPFAHRTGSGRCGDPERMETFVHGPLRAAPPPSGAVLCALPEDEAPESESFGSWWEDRRMRNPRRGARRNPAREVRLRPYLFEAVFYSPHSRSLYHYAVIDVDAASEREAEEKAYAVLVLRGKATRVLGAPVTLRPIGPRHRWADGYRPAAAPILRASENPSKTEMDVAVRVGLALGVAALLWYAVKYVPNPNAPAPST